MRKDNENQMFVIDTPKTIPDLIQDTVSRNAKKKDDNKTKQRLALNHIEVRMPGIILKTVPQ